MRDDQDPHWYALLGSGAAIGTFLAGAGPLFALLAAAADGGTATFRAPTGDIACMMRATLQGEMYEPVVAYPGPMGHEMLSVEVGRVTDHEDGGIIVDASFHGLGLSFYDTFYDYDRARVQSLIGRRINIALAGIALKAQVIPPEELEASNFSPQIAALIPARVVYPENPSRPDWFAFYAFVREALTTELAGETLHKLDVCLLRPDEGELGATLYVSRHVTPEGFDPRPGDVLSGVLWLSGYEAREA